MDEASAHLCNGTKYITLSYRLSFTINNSNNNKKEDRHRHRHRFFRSLSYEFSVCIVF